MTSFFVYVWLIVSTSHIATGVGLFFIIRYFRRWSWLQAFPAVFLVYGLFGMVTIFLAYTSADVLYSDVSWVALLRIYGSVVVQATIALMTIGVAILIYRVDSSKKPTMLAAYAEMMRLKDVLRND